MSRSSAAPSGGASLATLEKGCVATITGIRAPDGPAWTEHVQRLMELGFLPGTPVRVIATGFPSNDPIAVRLGRATFALRRFEADLISVSVEAATASGPS